MIITVPTWLLWAAGLLVGVPVILFTLACAYIGLMFVLSAGSRK